MDDRPVKLRSSNTTSIFSNYSPSENLKSKLAADRDGLDKSSGDKKHEYDTDDRIRSLKEEQKEELIAMKNALSRREEEFNTLISKKDSDINDLLGRLEESRSAREESKFQLALVQEALSLEKKRVELLEKSIDDFNHKKLLEIEVDDTKVRDLESELNRKVGIIKKLEENVSMQDDMCSVLKSQLKESEAVITFSKKESASFKKQHEELKRIVENKEIESRSLAGEISRLQKANAELQKEIEEHNLKEINLDDARKELLLAQEKIKMLEKDLHENHRAKAELKIDVRISARRVKELEKETAENEERVKHLESNVSALKDACSLLEGQLKDSENVIANSRREASLLKEEVEQLKSLMATTKAESSLLLVETGKLRESNSQFQQELQDYRFLREQLSFTKNELSLEREKVKTLEKTIQDDYKENANLKADSRIAVSKVKELEREVMAKDERIKESQTNVKLLKEACTVLEGQLKDFETGIAQSQEEASSWKAQVEHLKALVISSRGESDTFLTEIVGLKGANIKLQGELNEIKGKCERYDVRVKEMNEQLSALTVEKMDTEIRLNCIIEQQTKLVEHLRKQLELAESKKNRGLVERIFGSNTPDKRHATSSSLLKTPMKSRTLESPSRKVKKLSQASSPSVPVLPSPTQILTEIQNINTIPEVKEEREKQECVLLKNEEPNSSPVQKVLVYREEKNLGINSCIALSNSLHLLGCEDGLYSINQTSGVKTKIDGMDAVWAMSMETGTDFAIFIEGPQRRLSRVHLRTLSSCAEAASCSKPRITATSILDVADAYLLKVRGSYIAVAGEKYLKIILIDKDQFHKRFDIQTPANVTSLLLTSQQTVLYGTDMVYELDLMNGQIEEFMDRSDRSLQVNIANCKQFNQFPIAILELSNIVRNQVAFNTSANSSGSLASSDSNSPIQREYLVAFPDFAIFLDEWGRRVRDKDIVWSKLPTAVEYSEPNLFIEHFTSVEIIHLNNNSFMRQSEPSVFSQLKTPKLLGSAAEVGTMFVVSTTKDLTEVYRISLNRLTSRD